MKTTIQYIALFAFLACAVVSWSQESIGIGISNYSPSNSLLLNPSSISDSKALVDIHFAGTSFFVRNNFAYIPGGSTSISAMINDPSSVPLPSYNLNRKKYHVYSDILIQGPTITFQIKNNAFGLYTGVRVMSDVRGIPNFATDYIDTGLQNPELMGQRMSVKNLRATAMAWSEFGLSYGRIIKQSGNEMVNFGIHVKRLIGGGGASVRLNNWDYTVLDSMTMVTHDIQGSYGIREPAWKAGTGWGVDVGITFKKTLSDVTSYVPHSKSSGCKTCDYRYKLSLAILDLGMIKYKPDFFTNEFNNDSEYQWDDFTDFGTSTASDISGLIDSEFGLDSGQKEKFRTWLPTALSAQFDYNLGYNFYLNASLVQGVPWFKSMGVQRSGVLSATPRFETKRFELAMPMSLYEYRDPMIGAMVRLNSIVIGTDNIGSYLFKRDVYGADLYVHIKYTIFKSWACRKVKNRPVRVKKVSKSGEIIPCPSW